MSSNRGTFQMVVAFLGVSLLLCVAGIIALAAQDKAIPGILENLAIGLVGSIGALLARTPSEGPQDVTVVNAPLPVDPQ